MKYILKNKLISDNDMPTILHKLREDSGYRYMKYIGNVKGNNVKITCPFHKNGEESRPSCFVFTNEDDNNVIWGTVKCFTCGTSMSLHRLVSHCLNCSIEEGKQWLLDNFGNTFIEEYELLDEISISKEKKILSFKDESELENYSYLHPYHFKRGLTEDIIKKFKIGYDFDTDCITMPVWDENDNLISIVRRSVSTKKYILEENKNKPVYLLNFIKKDYHGDLIYVCESQINALTLWSWGYKAIALLGTGSKSQYEILNRSGIRNYMLCLDGDTAGDKGTLRFLENINKDCIVSIKAIPRGKDVNDLSKEEFENLPIK